MKDGSISEMDIRPVSRATSTRERGLPRNQTHSPQNNSLTVTLAPYTSSP